MTARHLLFALAALTLWLSAGCGGNGNTVTADETTDPVYQRAQDLKKQGRNGEALSAFLKVIDRRGETGAPESHLEAATLYRVWAKDPVEAYHHFSKYLALQPTGPRAEVVRGQREAAKRDLARMLLVPPGEQSSADRDEVEQLRRRVQTLEAELQAIHGTAGLVPMRTEGTASAPPIISLGEESAPPPSLPPAPVATTPAPGAAPGTSSFTRGLNPSGATASRAATPAERPTATPARPTTPQRPTAPAASAGRRSHTVAAHESLWAIARRYYGAETNAAKVQGIYEANRDQMKTQGDLRVGMVLRIP